MIRVAGSGPTLIGAYGGLQRFVLHPGERLVVDTGHLVAWSEKLQLRIGPLGGAVTAVTVGEGLVGQFTAVGEPGVVWAQTRSEQQLRSWMFPDRRQNVER